MPPEWLTAPGLTPYADAVTTMETRAAAIRDVSARELVWLVEHPPLYTAGVSASPAELVATAGLPVIATGRGGRTTYHGPGQRIAYVMLDLDRRGRDVRAYVAALEAWIIAALGQLGVRAAAVLGRTGVWVEDAKIAAIGVRVRRWVSFHGFAVNVAPDLARFAGIVPCGIDRPVTSLAALGVDASMADLDRVLAATFDRAFSCADERGRIPLEGPRVLR